MATTRPMTKDDLSPNAVGRGRRSALTLAFGLLFLSAIPDATVVPVLKGLLVDRYDVDASAAHAFMAVNLLGAIVSAGFARRLRRTLGTRKAIVIAAGCNGILLAAMALPIGFAPTLLLRTVEGAMDLIVYAVLFSAIGDLGSPTKRGGRMGAAATAMMLGIALGLGLGGVIGGREATLALWMGVVACFIVSLLAATMFSDVTMTSGRPRPTTASIGGSLWPALLMMFSDRCASSLLVTTVPLYLTMCIGMDESVSGGMIGLSMLLLAIGAWPAGRVADRIGPLNVRVLAGVMFAGLFIVIPFAASNPAALLGVMAGLGLSGAALMATSLEIVCRSRRGVEGMHLLHAAGNAGFFVGPLIAGGVLALLTPDGTTASATAYSTVMLGFAVMHLTATILSTSHLHRVSINLSSEGRTRRAMSMVSANVTSSTHDAERRVTSTGT